jgi:hypothetical protein
MRSLVLAAALCAVACSANTPTGVPTSVAAGQPFDLAVGGSARVTGPIAVITFVAVVEDSRCPVGSLVVCVWAGNARVRLQVEQSGTVQLVEINTNIEPTQAFVGTLSIRLTAISPDAQLGSIPSDRYRATLIANGRAD